MIIVAIALPGKWWVLFCICRWLVSLAWRGLRRSRAASTDTGAPLLPGLVRAGHKRHAASSAASTNISVPAVKPEEKRLKWSAQTGAYDAKIRVEAAAGIRNRAQLARLMPRVRTHKVPDVIQPPKRWEVFSCLITNSGSPKRSFRAYNRFCPTSRQA
jgi:hypothetical protein